MRRILIIVCLLIVGMLSAAACDNYVRVTAPDTTINVVAPNRPHPPAAPAQPAPTPNQEPRTPDTDPNVTEPGSTDAQDPPVGVDPTGVTTPPPVLEPPCDPNGRGDGNGTPGNGKGRGDERGNGQCTE